MSPDGSVECQSGHSVGERRRSEGGCTSTVQHQSLVDVTEPVNFMIGALESHLQLFLDGLEVLDVANSWRREEDQYNELIIECVVWGKKPTSIENRDFACLLVRGREGFLETGIPFPEFVASSLLGLDALLADSFAARVTRSIASCCGKGSSGLEFLIVIVIGLVLSGGSRRLAPVGGAGGRPVRGHSDGVETLRPGNCGVIGRGVSSAASAEPARLESIGELSTAQVVGQHRGRDVGKLSRR